MSTARQSILSRLRNAGATPKSSEGHTYHPWAATSEQELEQRFIDCITASHADVIRTNTEQLGEVLTRLIENKQLHRIALGTGGEFQSAIDEATKQVEQVPFEREVSQWKTELFEKIDAGITHCLAGIADTGTLVLWPDSQEPRTLSLVPPTHIALLKRSTLVSNFAELMNKQAWHIGMPTNAILVSGPSKTADIQQTLAYGAHGPKELIVVMIED